MKETNFSEQQKRWQALIEDQRSSGMTRAEFCKRRGVSVSSFYSWAARFKKKGNEKKIENNFIRVEESLNEEPMRITFQSGVSLHFTQTPDPEWITLLVKLVS